MFEDAWSERTATFSNEYFGCDPRPNVRKFGKIYYKFSVNDEVILKGWESQSSSSQHFKRPKIFKII